MYMGCYRKTILIALGHDPQIIFDLIKLSKHKSTKLTNAIKLSLIIMIVLKHQTVWVPQLNWYTDITEYVYRH